MAHSILTSGKTLNWLSAAEIARGVRAGSIDPVLVVEACLDRIAARDTAVQAWVEIDREAALRNARGASASGGLLAGVPFGVKDVLDAAELPTQMGSVLYRGHAPRFDAGCVGMLRMAGALVLGKTATCEFAGIQPTTTRNPLDPSRTPGGSSSGSAAAVADGMVHLAFGTQTGGSVLRPASFCGVVGFKPTYGFYPVSGMKEAAHSFDTVGTIARSVEDIGLVHAVLMGLDPTTLGPLQSAPRIGLVRTHLWDTIEPAGIAAFEAVASCLKAAGAAVRDVRPPHGFERITQRRATINAFERARALAGEWFADRAGMAPLTAGVVERGFYIGGAEYASACADVEMFRAAASAMFADVDILLTPVTPGEAPSGIEKTGDPRLQELWTMLHMPSMAIPSGRGPSGLPLGVQLVSARFEDSRLLSAAGWIERVLERASTN